MPGHRVIENDWITLADGNRLAARIWMPDGPGPFPAVLEYLPYRKRNGTAPRDELTYPVFAEARHRRRPRRHPRLRRIRTG